MRRDDPHDASCELSRRFESHLIVQLTCVLISFLIQLIQPLLLLDLFTECCEVVASI